MANSYRSVLLAFLKLTDLAVIAAAFTVGLCFALPTERVGDLLAMQVRLGDFLATCGYLVYWHLLLSSFGLYRSHRLAPVSREWRDVLSAVALGAAPIAFLAPPLGLSVLGSEFLAAFVGTAAIGLLAERRLVMAVARRVRRHGRNLRHVVVVGDGPEALETASRLARRADLGYRVGAILETSTDGGEGAVLDRLAATLEETAIDEVFVALPLDRGQRLIRGVLGLCEERGVTVRVLATVADLALARAQVDEMDGQPVLSIFTGPVESPLLVVKRLVDIVVASVALIVLAPVFLLIALLVRLDSRGPVFFVQHRVGLGGRRFHFVKFRTMVPNAEALQKNLEHLNEADGPVFKITEDPRITRIGRILRRTSLDELPQLINVLRGDMSLVGPRPLPVRDVARFGRPSYRRRFAVKPGITCLWQVQHRTPEFDAWVKTDMHYIDNWSLALDFKILLRTIPAVLAGRGAV